MRLAVINNQTKKVENTIVPPESSQVWVAGSGYTAVLTEIGEIGDTWDGVNFVKPVVENE